MKRLLDIALAVLVTVGWWGVVYPHLSMIEDTCRVICESGEVRILESVDEYFDMLQAEPGEISIKIRLLERHG
ncbi:MAG: hypothetical protein IJ485_00730 [Lachnospiraceae bacterium]|nr:hypothetical protein [Lachnospiraceae bacterium]